MVWTKLGLPTLLGMIMEVDGMDHEILRHPHTKQLVFTPRSDDSRECPWTESKVSPTN